MAAKMFSDDHRLATSCAAESQLNGGRSLYIHTKFYTEVQATFITCGATVYAQRCMFMHKYVIQTT